MQGAREYAKMFRSGQHGRLYLVAGEHARGRIFHIFVLPTDAAIPGSPWSEKDSIEVYGITGGQPGWTETYGWLHRGKWEQDFAALVDARRDEIAAYMARCDQEKAGADAAERRRRAELLGAY